MTSPQNNVAQQPETVPEPLIKQFTASDGYQFHYRHWKPQTERPLGYVVALHGIQSHSGWYDASSQRMLEAGFDVRYLDRRGSGLNEENRGHAPHADRLVNDVVQFLSEIRHERNQVAPNVPVILLAVSWSGKLGATIAARRPELVDALGLLYPGICPRIHPSWQQKIKLKLAMWRGWGRAKVPIPLGDPALFTAVPERQAYIRNDSLALHRTTVSFLAASRALDVYAAAVADRLYCPTLLMLAGRDCIIDNPATHRYYDRIASQSKTLIEYPNAAHTLEFEPDREVFLNDLTAWLDSVRGCY
jgi:alpha-beta hydrolase superfamily lysophospholipase